MYFPLNSKTRELETLGVEHESRMSALQQRLSDVEQQLSAEKNALDTEKKRNAILQVFI